MQIPGMPGVRAWGDEFSPVFQKDAIEAREQQNKNGLFEKRALSVSWQSPAVAVMGHLGQDCYAGGLQQGHAPSSSSLPALARVR